jgi:hypothetical protein
MNTLLATRPIYTGISIDKTLAMSESAHPKAPEPPPRVHEALTDMHAYVLVLDAEWQCSGSDALHDELQALRGAVKALRLRLDPGGHFF